MDKNNCRECGAVGTTCCETARARLETANSLGRLVHRQSQEITKLKLHIADLQSVQEDLRRKIQEAA